jgi:hypothetical protein
MACYKCYLPNPPRAWSRVQNSCSLNDNPNPNELVQVPYTKELVPQYALSEKLNMLNKGNVLQYKMNSSNLTQKQRYSLIAKGKWVNRNTTWASQSTRGYTNPNTTSLKRVANYNLAIDPNTGLLLGPTDLPPSCPKFETIINSVLPSDSGGSSLNPEVVPPPPPPNPSNDNTVLPPSPMPVPIGPIVIQDSGNLICSIQENVCTGESVYHKAQQLCNPTSDSDVPGTIQLLCWNDGTPTWFPRQRYIMTNSANKWPTSSGPQDKTFVSAVRPSAPIITSVTNLNNIVTINWEQVEICLPVDRFSIYQNDVIIGDVEGSVFTFNIVVDYGNTYNYFIIAKSSQIMSDPSNIVSIVILSS